MVKKKVKKNPGLKTAPPARKTFLRGRGGVRFFVEKSYLKLERLKASNDPLIKKLLRRELKTKIAKKLAQVEEVMATGSHSKGSSKANAERRMKLQVFKERLLLLGELAKNNGQLTPHGETLVKEIKKLSRKIARLKKDL